ncbi:MAG: hypothetical protein J6K16_04165 [Alphaproteobacteria bacterium]|nr:hypothetical protein [Alphaproteobacteria bacterium]
MSDAIIVRAGNVTKSYVDAKLDLKADKIEGKGLSTNDYDNTAKEAVDSLGTASKCNTGTKEGNVPIINSEGKIDSSVLPSLAITDTFTAEDQDQMIGLSAQKGDVCVRTDENKTYILQKEPATEITNWLELATPTDSVQSVNGKTGVVTLNHQDIGAVESNTEIVGSTKCKITYDSKGLVTAGEDLVSDDIPDISATYETKSNKSDSFTESSSETYTSTKALVDGLATKAEIKKYTATISTTWTSNPNGEYTQEITLDGISETDTPTIDLVLSDDVSIAKSQIESWSCVSRITTSTGKLTVYCYDVSPTTEIPIQIICVR